MGRNSVTFTSAAPLEDIVGTSREIAGHIVFDPSNPQKGGHGKLTVSVASWNTGIPLRDEHLLGADWLNAEKFPNITLEIESVKDIKSVKQNGDFQTFDVTLVGTLSFHGQTRPVEIPGRFTYLKESEQTRAAMPGDLLAARAEFDVALADYGITGPKGMDLIGTKVGQTITVAVSFRASNAAASMAANPCNPCGGKKTAGNPCNPCGGKVPANPCNPCGGK
jgi:polyisoprenoid-binding protein YceI